MRRTYERLFYLLPLLLALFLTSFSYFELRNNARYFNDDELINDLKSVVQILGKDSVSSEEYNKHGKFCHGTFQKRFGGWMKACIAFIDYKKGDVEFVKLLNPKPKMAEG
ncbi:MAG: hypothetical protein NUV74_10110 [Candidatus Brocadiaceae bacterium]|nr:hypothetical protein [Candidatus Brocadiaceae bacterium]